MEQRKVLSMILVIAMFFGLTACSQTATVEPSPEIGTTPMAVKDPIKIGFLHIGETGGLAIETNRLVDYVGEVLGVEVVYGGALTSVDSVITNAENLIAAGVDGIIVCNFTEQSMVNIAKMCEENHVYFAQYFRTLTDKDVIAQLEGNKYYVGRTYESEYDVAYKLGMELVIAGSKNVALLSYNHGDTTAETRYKGYRDVFNENGVKIVAEEWDIAADGGAEVASNLLAAYPEIDGWALISSSYAPGVRVALENAGKGKMPIVGVDFYDSMEEDMRDGYLLAIGGGHQASAFYSFLMVYNAINGAYNSANFPMDVQDNILVLKNYEDYQNYKKWYVGDVLPYTAEEIKAMTITFNPTHTIADIQKAAKAISLEDVMTRHEGVVK
ncbi:MAG: sugar ABC transporter substrate-binding protein [Phycisphaerales bacterium]